MSKRNRNEDSRDARGPGTSEGAGFGGGGALRIATVVGVGLLILLNLKTMSDTAGFKQSVNERLDTVNNRIVALGNEMKSNMKAAAAPAAKVPDPNKVYTVKLQGAPSEGPTNAPIVIAEFSDFQCPYCSKVNDTLDQVKNTYGDKVRIVWKNYPLSFHQNAVPAANAAMAAHEQGKFWEYHKKLFTNQTKLSKDDLLGYARDLKLDMKQFEASFTSAKFKSAIDADQAEAGDLGVTGTPAFFVNGHFLSGAQPYEAFAKAINAELTKLNLPIPAGAANAGG